MATKPKQKLKVKNQNWMKILIGIVGVLTIVGLLGFKVMTKEVVFSGCGSRLPDYRYSLKFPLLWVVKQTSNDLASTYYEVRGLGSVFTASCTNQGVGGGCEPQYRTKFKVGDKEYDACFGLIDGVWKMNDFNLSTDKTTNATISFWSEGLERSSIEKILSSFKLVGNQ